MQQIQRQETVVGTRGVIRDTAAPPGFLCYTVLSDTGQLVVKYMVRIEAVPDEQSKVEQLYDDLEVFEARTKALSGRTPLPIVAFPIGPRLLTR